jgi:hypothetical protein
VLYQVLGNLPEKGYQSSLVQQCHDRCSNQHV